MSATQNPLPRSGAGHFIRPPAKPCAILRIACMAVALAQILLPIPARAEDPPPKEKPKIIIPVFRLSGPLSEAPADETLPFFAPPGASLKTLIARLGKSAVDTNVPAVVILPESASLGMAQAQELRQAVAQFRGHGKEVYVHASSLGTAQYLVASAASRVSVTPTGQLMIPGLHAESMHVRGLLDKIGVKPDFITEGAYKSASELFMREQPSPEADQMMNWLLDSWDGSLKEMVGRSRAADAAKVQSWIDTGLFSADQARAAGLIDAVEHQPDFEAMLKDRYGKDVIFNHKYGRDAQPDLDFSSPFAFIKIWGELLSGPSRSTPSKPAIGVVYVTGPIMTGRGNRSFGGGASIALSDDISEALAKAAADDSIKAVVLRVDSPGGSATASEIILDATRRLKAKKPFVVSMGDVAGSGGYYVACAADTIFADSTTMTGSIGVVAGKFASTEMWKKIGVTFKEYKRGQNAGIFSSDDVFSDGERARMRLFMDDVYAAFKNHVIESRGPRLKKPLEELAGGRVFTGKQALDFGLVDKLGTLTDAAAFVAGQANIKDYELRVIPGPKKLLDILTENLTGDPGDSNHVTLLSGEGSLLKLAAPYLQSLDPQRARSVVSAILRLDILQKEGVALTMPEILTME